MNRSPPAASLRPTDGPGRALTVAAGRLPPGQYDTPRFDGSRFVNYEFTPGGQLTAGGFVAVAAAGVK